MVINLEPSHLMEGVFIRVNMIQMVKELEKVNLLGLVPKYMVVVMLIDFLKGVVMKLE